MPKLVNNSVSIRSGLLLLSARPSVPGSCPGTGGSRRALLRVRIVSVLSPLILVALVVLSDRFLRLNLEAARHHALHACDGVSGLRLARTGAPDVVPLDVMLLGIDGTEVCRRLRTTPIIMLTSLEGGFDAAELLDPMRLTAGISDDASRRAQT